MAIATVRDAEADKARALRHAATCTKRRIAAEQAEAAALAFAATCGASLREIEAATGVPHMTVKRRIEGTATDEA
jgi:hypothetical protein